MDGADALAASDLRNRLVKFYVELAALRDYASLNYTAISKILKKHDKYMPTKLKLDFVRAHVDTRSVFGTLDELHALLTRTRVRRRMPEGITTRRQ